MKLPRFRFLNQKGQTAVEYMLILVVAITIGLTFKKKMEQFVLTNPDSTLSKQLNGLVRSLENDSSGRFSWFSMRM
jgi:hypothetical protein